MLLTVLLRLSRQAQPSQVYFTGKVKGEAAIKTETEIGSAITHQFRVSTEWLVLFSTLKMYPALCMYMCFS